MSRETEVANLTFSARRETLADLYFPKHHCEEDADGERHKKRKDSRTWTWKWGSLPEKSAFVVPVEAVPDTV